MIEIVSNSLGSGDWIKVLGPDREILFEGHRIGVYDLVSILSSVAPATTVRTISVDDEQMEEGDF